MKKISFITVCLLLLISHSYAQEITGKWYGRFNAGGVNLRLVFTIEQSGEGYTGTFLSPDQGSPELPVSEVKWEDNKLTLNISVIGVTYSGIMNEEEIIEGTFTQMGSTFPLNLSRQELVQNRPQEPIPPYPYYEEEVLFRNEKAGVNLAGTLTLPAPTGTYPAVVLITGSGPQNRDEEILGHKPFLVLADWLTRNGIAVLRYDERGVGASEGNYGQATYADFEADATVAIDYLKGRKEIDREQVGVIGHSEGGFIAFMLAGEKKVSFVVALAAPGIPGNQLLSMQREMLAGGSSIPAVQQEEYLRLTDQAQELALEITDRNKLQEEISRLFKNTMLAGQETMVVRQFMSPTVQCLLRADPAVYFKNITCPVFALNGEKDLQVPCRINLEAIQKGITENGNKQVVTKAYPGLNHLFQTAETGLPTEYSEIEETLAPVVLKDISEWIKTLNP